MGDRATRALVAYSKNNLRELEALLGIDFQDKRRLVTALSHRSSSGNPLFSREENKKLALIGDPLIDLVVFSSLYSGATTEAMDGARQRLATNTGLNAVARRLGLHGYMFLEDSVDEAALSRSVGLGADTVEALAGAIFVDRGFEAASGFVKRFVLPEIIKPSQ